MGKLPAVIAKSNHFATAVARACDQPTVVETVFVFQLFTALTNGLYGAIMIGSHFGWYLHLLARPLRGL